MRRWLVVLAMILVPVAASGQAFECPQQAFDLTTVDLTACADQTDLSTCPVSCADPTDSTTCVALPQGLPVIPIERTLADQPMFRQLFVRSGPHLGVVLSLVTRNEIADQAFAVARVRLCEPPPPPPPPPKTPPPPATTPPVVRGGPVWFGGNPGLAGGDPGINIRR